MFSRSPVGGCVTVACTRQVAGIGPDAGTIVALVTMVFRIASAVSASQTTAGEVRRLASEADADVTEPTSARVNPAATAARGALIRCLQMDGVADVIGQASASREPGTELDRGAVQMVV